MTVLDTNVLSEVLRPMPEDVVSGWLRTQERAGLFLTAITQAEILYGVEVLPAGKRRTQLLNAIEGVLGEFSGRILPFDEKSARVFPKIVAGRRKMGVPISQSDAMIAAVCSSQGATLATRNVRDFAHCGVRVVNPWE
jgi:predicted nucleic acid-binding protein